MKFDIKNKTVEAKIVFYGPALSGKTTSLKYLFKKFGKIEKIKSINSTTGRTLFFYFGILKFKGIKWEVKFLIYSTTGQDFYYVTRPTTIRGADGIIFVADSNFNSFQRNIYSWNELTSMYGNVLNRIPIVCNFNKQDLARKFDFQDFLKYIQHNKFKSFAYFKTTAILGDGVLSSFRKIIEMIFPGVLVNQVMI